MSDRLTPSELERLQSYVPSHWREQVGASPAPGEMQSYALHLQELLSAVGTYLPRAILIDDRELRAERGTFRCGTTLFADVSGFSTLTERFSQERGREGAEEITLIVNRFMETVNGISVQYGGDLLKFAGDAAISFYQGKAHAARACRAAWEMQRAMREQFACVKTSLGEFPLQMSIGLGSGEVFMASLGTSKNAEYAVMGPALATMGYAEHLAHAGQIVVDDTTRDLASEEITIAPTSDEGFFELRSVRSRPSAVERPDLRLAPPQGPPLTTLRWLLMRLDELTAYLPPGLLEKLIPSPKAIGVESDHRWVTTVFADLRGANDLVQVLGDRHKDLLAETINRYFLAMRKVIEHYEGVLHKVGVGPTGPHLFITFGAPKSHADDPERAVCAALEMQETLTKVNLGIETRISGTCDLRYPLFRQAIGITTGFVFAGSIGSARRWEYTVMGDRVNLAARLMAAAADGEILAAESTTHHLGRQFTLRPHPPIQVKGKREPVSYAQVTGLMQLPPLLGTPDGSLVGRQTELSTAQDLLGEALQSAGHVLVIRGEAGMGKSRLTQEIAREAQERGMRVIAGACLSYGGDIPYLPWADVLRTLLGITTTERTTQLQQLAQGLAQAGLTGWEPLVAEPLDLELEETELTASLDARLRQQRLFDIVLELVEAQARTQPFLLVIEDVHWADPTSLELLDYVGRNVASCAAVVLILHRPREWLDGRWQKLAHASEIALQELPGTAIQGLVADLLHTEEVPEPLIGLLTRKAQGNPFFTEEVTRALIDAGVLRKNGHWELVADPEQAGVPDTIHGVIQSRIDRLEETDRRVLQVASVIGRVFSEPLLGGVYPYDDLDGTLPRRLGQLGGLGLVLFEVPEPEPLYMFKHALTQDVAYESLSYARRREVHRRVGAFIETQGGEAASERPGFLAHHFFEGQDWRRALTYSLAAGRKAQREYANEAAIAHFERALHVAAELDEPGEEEQLEAHEALGEVLTLVGRYDEALGHLEAALALVETWHLSMERNCRLADLYLKIAETYEPQGNYSITLDWLKRGLTIPNIDDAAEGAGLYRLGAGVFHRQGKNELAREWCERSLEIATRLGNREAQAQGNYLLGAILTQLGKLTTAIESCEQSLLACRELGNLLGQFHAHNNLAIAYYHQDQWRAAVQHYIKATEIAERIGYAEGQARVASNLGVIYETQGLLKAASQQYQKALETTQRLGLTFGIALLHCNLGTVNIRWKKWQRAEKHLAQSLELFEEIGAEEPLAEIYRHYAEISLEQEELEKASIYAKRSLDYTQARNMHLEEGITWRVIGCLHQRRGELDKAEKALTQALEIAREANKRYETALTQLELARLRIQQGRANEGKEMAQQAAQVFAELGAQMDLQEVETLLQQASP